MLPVSRSEPMDDETRLNMSGAALRSCGMLVIIAVLSACCAGFPSFFVGNFLGSMGNDVARGNRDVDRVNKIVAANPEEFGSLTINRGPADKFHLEGTVRTQADLDHLRDEMERTFGEDRAGYILEVTVDGSANGG